MKLFFLLLSLFAASAAVQAEELRMPIPGEGWAVQVDGPHITQREATASTSGHIYTGNAGTLNVSLHVAAPDCDGGDSAENLYKCFGAKIQRVPNIINGTIRVGKAPDGVQISYLMDVPIQDRKIRIFNLNYLFANKGKWGDLHISVVQPTKADMEMAMSMMNSLKLVALVTR